MSDFLTRLIEERGQLNDRCTKLGLFLDGDKILTIDPIQADLLSIQFSAMETYRKVLDKRIELLKKQPA